MNSPFIEKSMVTNMIFSLHQMGVVMSWPYDQKGVDGGSEWRAGTREPRFGWLAGWMV